MELIGEEQRIQALSSEQRLADERITPSFGGLWGRAQLKAIRTQRALNLSFAAAASLLVCALALLAAWSEHWQLNPDVVPTVPQVSAPVSVKVGGENKEVNLPKPLPKGGSPGTKPRALKLAARREALLVAANRRAARAAKTIASWQSPTARLLDSHNDELLKSVPQLNQTVDELKSFLPRQPK